LGHHERQKLDESMPMSATPTPLLIWVDGGRWEEGSKEGYASPGWSPTGTRSR